MYPIVDYSEYNSLDAALVGVVPSLRTLNMGRSLYPWQADMNLPLTRLSIVRPSSREDEGKDLYRLCRSCPDLRSLCFQYTARMGFWAEVALASCAGTLQELHVMFETSLPDRNMEPMIPLAGLPRLKRLETLYIDMSTLFGPSSGLGRMDSPGRIEELLPCPSLRKLHVFNDYALAKRHRNDYGYGGGGDDYIADAVLRRTLIRPLLEACDEARFPHLRLVSVRTPILRRGRLRPGDGSRVCRQEQEHWLRHVQWDHRR
ncbi:hypothetical protein PG991_008955 [Apiospora marii]|uniref:F-box domain-containing protein n=1 Tax=Apiospora marii TaxID=335849 RepID=A0ABR1RJA2_9PEZI